MDADDRTPTAPPTGFAATLRAAIAASGLSLGDVRARLVEHDINLSIATLSYWQSGRSRPERATSLSALGPLEEVLGVPRGHLVSRVAFARPVATEPGGDADVRSPWPAAGEALDALGLAREGAVSRRSLHDRVELGPAGQLVRQRVRSVLTAKARQVEAYPVWAEHSGPAGAPTVRGVVNCRLGRVVAAAEGHGVAAEMLLDAPLARGESVLVEHEITPPDDAPWEGYVRYVAEEVREVVIEVAFHPARLPASAEGLRFVDEQETVTPLDPRSPLVVVVPDAAVGFHGLRWTW